MKNLKLKCPKCNKVFRTGNGLAWHLLHRHDYKLTLDQLKSELDKRRLALLPLATRQRHSGLMQDLLRNYEAQTAYIQKGFAIDEEPLRKLKAEEQNLLRQLQEIEMQAQMLV